MVKKEAVPKGRAVFFLWIILWITATANYWQSAIWLLFWVWKNQKRKVVFKTYTPDQISLLPDSYDELIPEEHLVRMLNTVIDKMKIDPLLAEYKGGGNSSYHPKMLLKVIVYGYCAKIYSSRKIAKALRENFWTIKTAPTLQPHFLIWVLVSFINSRSKSL